jgi:hypothetical protein
VHDAIAALDVVPEGNPRRRLLVRSKGGAVVEVVFASHGDTSCAVSVHTGTEARARDAGHSTAASPAIGPGSVAGKQAAFAWTKVWRRVKPWR